MPSLCGVVSVCRETDGSYGEITQSEEIERGLDHSVGAALCTLHFIFLDVRA